MSKRKFISQEDFQPAQDVPNSVFQVQSHKFVDFLEGKGGIDPHQCFNEHQVDATLKLLKWKNDISASADRPRVGLAVLPTDADKSGVAVMSCYALNARKVLVVTPSMKISKQLEIAFGLTDQPSFLEERGLIGTLEGRKAMIPSGRVITSTTQISTGVRTNSIFLDVTIVNAQKFGTRSNVDLSTVPNELFDLVVVDGAHHYSASTWTGLVDHFERSFVVFLASKT